MLNANFEKVVLLLSQLDQIKSTVDRLAWQKTPCRIAVILHFQPAIINPDRTATQGIFHLFTRPGHAHIRQQLDKGLRESLHAQRTGGKTILA